MASESVATRQLASSLKVLPLELRKICERALEVFAPFRQARGLDDA